MLKERLDFYYGRFIGLPNLSPILRSIRNPITHLLFIKDQKF